MCVNGDDQHKHICPRHVRPFLCSFMIRDIVSEMMIAPGSELSYVVLSHPDQCLWRNHRIIELPVTLVTSKSFYFLVIALRFSCNFHFLANCILFLGTFTTNSLFGVYNLHCFLRELACGWSTLLHEAITERTSSSSSDFQFSCEQSQNHCMQLVCSHIILP